VAMRHEVTQFVLVSTDKAVNAKTVMGQSKALCEWIVEAYGAREDVSTRFVAVRFGNVLGSSGSVIPIFRRQIEKGGPVTVTHREMTRFFMTIPEAASLVIQSGSIGGEGHVFVLDMGDPVKIVELAEQMIRLSGKDGARSESTSSALVRARSCTRSSGARARPWWPLRIRRSAASAAPSSTPSGCKTSSPSWSAWSRTARRSRLSRA